MITDKEYKEVSLSPTKKDYYQIWNEIIDLATKISSRWSPDSTNESDPGIVLLKAAVALADKLNYNIDKNTLEAFMPSATQADSMRKLTEMMGYNMKYYQAATCDVSISYKTSNEKKLSDIGTIYFPKFVNIKNEEEDINYVTVEDFTLQPSVPTKSVPAVEGELIECETDNDNIISMIHLDDNNRYLLPEVNVAENAVFVFNVSDSTESERWKQVDNLNTLLPGTQAYKFGFDSAENLPYLQFPEDISQIIKDGLRIKYVRTNGINGNVARGTLTKLSVPSLWGTAENEAISGLTADQFSVNNVSAAMNGANPESINSAYNNFKKTVGTFDTLITCRDYMNKIYQLTMSETDTTPLVSNVIVSDIRDDINNATTLCSFNEYGISYSDVSLKDTNNNNLIEHFDLMLYPFKTIYGLNRRDEFLNSFTYNSETTGNIKYDLNECKSIAHNIRTPNKKDVACIKNYLRLKARITTTKKVTTTEEKEILNNIYTNIFKKFNNRYIDGGEEIPYDALVEVIEEADPRIKDVSLDEPALYTAIARVNGEEEILEARPEHPTSLSEVDMLYNKLALRNILAGRIAAFQYDEDFKTGYDESPYPGEYYDPTYPSSGKYISELVSQFTVDSDDVDEDGLLLKENEVIQFRLPNFRTVNTYPCYTNYFIKLDNLSTTDSHNAVPATFISLATFMEEKNGSGTTYWEAFVNDQDHYTVNMKELGLISTQEAFNDDVAKYGGMFIKNGTTYNMTKDWHDDVVYWVFELKENSFALINRFIQAQTVNSIQLNGLYRSTGADLSRDYGKFVDINYIKYLRAYTYASASTVYSYYVQQTHASSEPEIDVSYTDDGIGLDANLPTIDVDAEYELTSGEYLLINYTKSTTDDSGTEKKSVVNKYYGPGTIIKPNFGLMDSELYHNNHSYSKKDGFYFVEQPKCPGMFALGTNEQIMIRDFVKVELDEEITNLYWELNSDNPEAETNEFPFDEYYDGGYEDPDNPGHYLPNAYTLREGEHLYYTNAKKADLVYYGSGTTIIKSPDTPILQKHTSDGEISEEDIMTYGIAAAIPWTSYNLAKQQGKVRKITVLENQYVSLTEGDILKYISETEGDEKSFSMNFEDNDWHNIESATYKLAESEATDSLPKVKVSNLKWQARSRLDFNMGPTSPQILNKGDSITFYQKNLNSSASAQGDATVIYPRTISGKLTPIAVFSNYICQAADHKMNVAGNSALLKKLGLDIKKDFKLKLASLEKPAFTDGSGSTVNLDNYENGDAKFTKIAFENLPVKVNTPASSRRSAFTLKTNILNSDQYGLIMFYYKNDNYNEAGQVKAKIVATSDSGDTDLIGRFNIAGATLNTTYQFVPGIQVLQISKKVKSLTIWPDFNDNDESKAFAGILIFSDLSLVKDINPKLDYRYNESDSTYNTALKKMLKDIQSLGIADDFFYNVTIDNSSAIELNPYVADDKLSSPLTWYDPNNTNNKFVISEIDADYLSTGITLTRASRL